MSLAVFKADQGTSCEKKVAPELEKLKEFQASHPFWNNRLFKASVAGELSIEDWKFIFEQYYLYSKNFTRYIAGLMCNLDNDLFRSQLSENLWEEGGGAKPEERHAQIFREFLKDGLDIDVSQIQFLEGTKFFVNSYLDYSGKADAISGSAFLSLGTEGVVARMYGLLVEGMLKCGMEEEHLRFFRIHMECDDAHAETLENIMLHYSDSSEWFEKCKVATDFALSIRMNFFNHLMDMLEHNRVKPHIKKIQDKKSLFDKETPNSSYIYQAGETQGAVLYANKADELNIDFRVEKTPFASEVLDTRIVKIPPQKFNERHRHAHETVFYFLSGCGRVLLDERWVEVKKGDIVFVPRWSLHQSQNLSHEEMVILAVTDYNLTGKVFSGDYNKTARMKKVQ